VGLDGSTPQEIRTGLKGFHTMPQWSPDGDKIAFSEYSGGGNDLWVIEDLKLD
jgi:Tol biopolymer transport system component